MKIKAALLFLLASGEAVAQDSTTEPASSAAEPPASEEVNSAEGANSVSEPAAEEAETEIAPQPTGLALDVTVVLKSGVTLTGSVSQTELLSWTPEADLVFTPHGGAVTTVPGSDIVSVTQAGENVAPVMVTVNPSSEPHEPESTYRSPGGFRHPNPAANRYLYAPSAINMEAGQGYVSQKLLFTAVAYAPTDNLTILFGGFTLFPPLASVLGGKYSFGIKKNLTASVGGEVFNVSLKGNTPLGIGFGALTFGNEDRHLTIGSGYAAGSIYELAQIPLMVAGQLRASEGFALITENWLLYDFGRIAAGKIDNSLSANISSVAIRLVGRRDRRDGSPRGMRTSTGYPKTTWDIGFVMFGTIEGTAVFNEATRESEPSEFKDYSPFGPIPWIDWTWHFGKAKY